MAHSVRALLIGLAALATIAPGAAEAVVGLPVAKPPPRVSGVRRPALHAARAKRRATMHDAPAVIERWTAGEWREAPRPSVGTDRVETRPRSHQTWEDAPEDVGPN